MNTPDKKGNTRHWILEIHFVDRDRQIGGFFEQLLIPVSKKILSQLYLINCFKY